MKRYIMAAKSNVDRKLVAIAKKYLVDMQDRSDLKAHNSDSEDFLDVAVWELESALRAAYELGKSET